MLLDMQCLWESKGIYRLPISEPVIGNSANPAECKKVLVHQHMWSVVVWNRDANTGLNISSKALQIEAYKSCSNIKMLQGYIRHVEQQSRGRKTQTETAAIYLTTFKNGVHYSCKYTKRWKTFVLMFMPGIWIAFGCVWIVCIPLFWGDLMRPLKCMKQMQNIMHCMQELMQG